MLDPVMVGASRAFRAAGGGSAPYAPLTLPGPALSGMTLAERCHELGDTVERMVAVQMHAYPSSWTEEERREMAERYLFGSARS